MRAKQKFGDEHEEIIDDIKSIFGQEAPEPDAYDVRMKCISELQKGLEIATEDAPLIFIIDELDRCNPSFAIKTLEVAKHLLDVKNIIFIFALDMHQMRAAVKKFYGQDIDADGYLCKVFDYFTILPAPSHNEYILQCMQSIYPQIEMVFPKFVEFAIQTIQTNNCTLRFIDTFIASFRVAWHSFVQEYKSSNTYILYFYALFLKYRYPELFLLTTQYVPLSRENEMKLNKIGSLNEVVKSYTANCTSQITQFDKYNYLGVGTAQRKYYEQIQHLTLGQFIHRQLEMYNPFPSEKPDQ